MAALVFSSSRNEQWGDTAIVFHGLVWFSDILAGNGLG